MTIENSNLLLTVEETDLKKIESFSMSLLTMTETYELPDTVNSLIQDLVDEAETLRARALMNYHCSESNPKLGVLPIT